MADLILTKKEISLIGSYLHVALNLRSVANEHREDIKALLDKLDKLVFTPLDSVLQLNPTFAVFPPPSAVVKENKTNANGFIGGTYTLENGYIASVVSSFQRVDSKTRKKEKMLIGFLVEDKEGIPLSIVMTWDIMGKSRFDKDYDLVEVVM